MASGDVNISTGINPIAFNCASFDGINDYIDIPHTTADLGTSYPNGMSVSCWVYPTTAGGGGYGRIVDLGFDTSGKNGFSLSYNTGSAILIYLNGSGGTAPGLELGKWHHVVGIWGPESPTASLKVYIDNVLVINTTVNKTLSQVICTSPIRIGNRCQATDRGWKGGIRDLRFYNKVLTATEIASLYAGLNIAETPVHWFKLKDNYNDYGSVGGTGTNSGSIFVGIEGTLNQVIKTQRATAGDTYKALLTKVGNGQIISVFIDE